MPKNAPESKIKELCKYILEKKRTSNIRIFIYDNIKYTPNKLPVPEKYDDHWLYLYGYNKNTGLDDLDKIQK